MAWATVAKPDRVNASPLEAMIHVETSAANSRIASLIAEAPEEQSSALKDGSVSLAEYRAAVQGTLSCFDSGFEALITDAGLDQSSATLTFDGPTVSADGFEITYGYTIKTPGLEKPSSDDFKPIGDREEACQATHQRQTEQIYQLQKLSDPEFVREAVSTFSSCATAAGVPDLGSTEDAVLRTLQAELQRGADQDGLVDCLAKTPSVSSGLVAE